MRIEDRPNRAPPDPYCRFYSWRDSAWVKERLAPRESFFLIWKRPCRGGKCSSFFPYSCPSTSTALFGSVCQRFFIRFLFPLFNPHPSGHVPGEGYLVASLVPIDGGRNKYSGRPEGLIWRDTIRYNNTKSIST